MKKALIIVFVYSFVWVVTSCGNKTQDNNQETHVHQDGTAHEGAHHHEHEEKAPEQESFIVGEDSTEAHEHHDDGHDQDHDHDHEHEH